MFIPSLVFVSAGVTVGRPVVLVTIAKWTEVEIIFKQGKIMAKKFPYDKIELGIVNCTNVTIFIIIIFII